jgi:uncharacterized protein (TIGR00730 family)
MHERKALMAELSDGFIALPGGIGTMEEFSKCSVGLSLAFTTNPAPVERVGYYDPLIEFLDHAVSQDFVKPKHRALLIVEHDPMTLLDRFAKILRAAGKKIRSVDSKI